VKTLHSGIVLAVAWTFCLANAVQAQSDALRSNLLRPLDLGAPLERIDDALDSRLDEILADYDRSIAARPHDVVGYVERCAFLDELQIRFEYSIGWDRLNVLSMSCIDELHELFEDHPELQLFELERMYGSAKLERGLAIDARVGRQSWTRGQLGRLYYALAIAAEQLGDSLAGAMALKALEYDRTAPVRLIAATGQIEQGNRDGAIELLSSPFDDSGRIDSWYLSRKLALLSELGV
jgi:tetratricopeptide (TPR) repeat protein